MSFPISRETIMAVLDKATTANDSLEGYSLSMEDVLKDRGHEELYTMMLTLISEAMPISKELIHEEKITLLGYRFVALATALATYSVVIASQEAAALDEQFA